MADSVVVQSNSVATIRNTITESVLVELDSSLSVTNSEQLNVVIEVDQTSTITKGEQGPPGPPGQSNTYVYAVAGTHLSGHRAISYNTVGQAEYCSVSSIDKLVGITTSAYLLGQLAQIQYTGELTEPSWSWDTNKPIFVGLDGTLTQTAPSTGFVCVIGFPITATKIFIYKQPPIILD